MRSPAGESAAQFRDNLYLLRGLAVRGDNFPFPNSKAFPKARWAEALTEPPDTVETLVSVNCRPVIRDSKHI
jgi:hypothetical protein